MGSDSPQAPTPAPAPSVSETTAQSIQAQIDALPKILAAQQQYGSQFSQQQLDSLNQFGPAFAQSALNLEQQFAPQYKQISDTLNPEIGVAQSTLASYLSGNDQQEYDALSPGLIDSVRSAQSQRGLGAISPLGSIDESVQLQQLKQSLKDRRLNIALSTAGRVPIGGIANVQGTTGTGQLVQNVSPGEAIGYQSSLNQFNSSIFNTQGGIYGSQLQQQGNPLGSILGGISGGLSGGLSAGLGSKLAGTALAMCWVASEVFNEPMDGPNVSNTRNYILNQAPQWFREMYIRSGRRIAEMIHGKEEDKAILRPLFEYFALKGAV